ncbi:glycosyl hydrolase [Flavobacterium mesophilum]|uniref:glycosyl hydrolase n=1 Tax=Flavobacterium mesophilum TaxID=3143495 RepID=UPI0031DF7B7E
MKNSHTDTLSSAKFGFYNPQDSTRTKAWWFHGETETTKVGITADLEAFKKAGVGGVIYYDQSHGKAINALEGFSKEWWAMLRFSAEEAARIGLTFELHLSNGYVAGGPWITNETSMKRLTATEIVVEGGKKFSAKLPEPKNKFNFFKDVVVLAFPTQAGAGKTSFSEEVKITSNSKEINLKSLFNPDSLSTTKIARNDSGVYINLLFSEDFEARSITYKMQPRGKASSSATNVPGPPGEIFVGTGYRVLPDFGQLEVSYDGVHYEKVCDLKPIYKAHESWRQKTISFNAVKSRYFRLNLHDWWEESEKNQELLLNSIVLNSVAKLDQYEEKAGLFAEYIEADKTPKYNSSEVIKSENIIDLTEKMDADGTLKWDVPSGNWVIMRFAYEPTGASTKHGRANLIGRECDKLSKEAAEIHWNNYVGVIADSLKKSNSGHLSGIAMDSHEAGAQNWTNNFIQDFKNYRGYDPTKHLPSMMGYVVDDVKSSDGFLFDVRRNIADLISDNYYGTFDKLAKARGLHFTAQAIGNALCIVGDPIQAKGKVEKPQGEFWVIHPNGNYDIKESSSATHLYGKKIASGEAFTDAKYSTSLAELKSLADYAYAFGINEFVICASAYQPWLDKIPGSTGGGRQYAINRNNTWWNYSSPFWDYQARSSYLMRLGKSTASICVYLGENAPVKIVTNRLPEIPGGFDFDAFSTDALLNRMDGTDGKIVLPDGVAYQMMVLPRNGDITLDALKKIEKIVEKGGSVYGSKPLVSKSAKDIGKEQEYTKISNQLWGGNPSEKGNNNFGKGKVYWGGTLKEALESANIQADLSLENSDCKSSAIYFTHRKLKDADVYFLDNHKDEAENNLFTFSSKGKQVQFWNLITGKRYAVPIEKNTNNCVSVRLSLAARESACIIITNVFENLPFLTNLKPSEIDVLKGPWEVDFDQKLGGVGKITFENLKDWTAFNDPKIKYYSGTAIYKKIISIDPDGKKVTIDVGNPNFVAQVFVNGIDAGTVWCSPWQVDITSYLKKGQNDLEIRVANSLMNRMIYDSQLPENERITYSYPSIASSSDKLENSGLKNVKLIIEKL